MKKKLWASKVVGVPILGISGLQVGNLETKWHLGDGPVAKHKKYYKEEGGDFPQVRAMMNLVSPWLFMTRLCTKSASTMH
jgi:hypothetical protein